VPHPVGGCRRGMVATTKFFPEHFNVVTNAMSIWRSSRGRLAGSCWPVIRRGLLGQLEHDFVAGFSGGGEIAGNLGTFGISIHEELNFGLYS
jgi:hypothetical protein